MLLIMFRVKVSNRHLHLPHLLNNTNTSVTTGKTGLHMNGTRGTIRGIRHSVTLRTFSLSIRMERDSNVANTGRPYGTIFLLNESRNHIHTARDNNYQDHQNRRTGTRHYYRRGHHHTTRGPVRVFRG